MSPTNPTTINDTTTVEYPWTDEDGTLSKIPKELQLNDHQNKNGVPTAITTQSEYKMEIVWRNVFLLGYVHLTGLYGLYLALSGQAKIITTIFSLMYAMASGFGVTAGAHRLWAHKAYKATRPLRILLAVFQTAALQNSIYVWCRDHRVHHKYTETDADPHNAKRGFFFSHVGWLLVKKHPDVLIKGNTIDMSDLWSDPIIQFQHENYVVLTSIMCFLVPTLFAWLVLGETLICSFFVAAMFRYALTLNGTWCVNSAAHLYGSHPYDATINPAENSFVSWIGLGEGWHNYHHAFPWDYRASELSPSKHNLTTKQIDLFARIGWAYDLKTVSKSVMMKRIERTGDGTYEEPPSPIKKDHDGHGHGHVHSGPWGWGDPDTPIESTEVTQILYPKNEKMG